MEFRGWVERLQVAGASGKVLLVRSMMSADTVRLQATAFGINLNQSIQIVA